MTFTVTLQPSGDRFTAEPEETVLEAGLRCGIPLNYSCQNGSCGDCRARIVAGEVAGLPHDFVMGEADADRGVVLLCRAQARSDLVVEAAQAGDVEDIPVRRIATSVYKLERPTDDVLVLQLRTPRSQTLRFLAGQHVRIHLDGLVPRNKSIASCPCNGMYLQFHVRRVAGDPFSDYVFNELKPRQKVDIEGPYGRFVLDEDAGRPTLFLAYETGFAPIKSLIEHAISMELARPLRLYWVGRNAADHYLANYCRSWRDALDDFQFVALSAEAMADAGTEVANGHDATRAQRDMLNAAEAVVRDLSQLEDWDVYASGPEFMLDRAKRVLLKHGLPPDRLFIDYVEKF